MRLELRLGQDHFERSTEPIDANAEPGFCDMRELPFSKATPGEGFRMQFKATGDMPMSGVVTMSTRWVDLGLAEPLPRELWVELRGHADNIDQAVGQYSAVARLLGVLAAFVANTRVGTIDVHLAYDCTEDHEERQFIETLLPDEVGGVADGRLIRVHLLEAVAHGYFTLNPKYHGRLNLALHQYQLAIQTSTKDHHRDVEPVAKPW